MRRGNCVVWALMQRRRHGGVIRIRRSPVYPLLPRASWSPDGSTWFRYMHTNPLRNPHGLKKWLPLHAIWFAGSKQREMR
jgi:hypothetical protein